jgi:S1-C subfamily serine protease
VIIEPTLEGTPIHTAGADIDDEILSVDGEAIGSPERFEEIVRRHKPGDTLRAVVRRRGFSEQLTIAVEEDPGLELLPVDYGTLSVQERAFRDAWLKSKVNQ